MDSGFIKLWRKTTDSRVFHNEGLLKVWIWCLMRASHKKRWVIMKSGKGEIEIEILPGQFVFGRNSAAKQLNMKPSTVRNRMEKLKNMLNVDIKEDRQYSIISIMNWGTYQPSITKEDSEEDSRRTIKGQSKDTNKNVEKEKNVEKTDIPPKSPKAKKEKKKFIPPTKEDVIKYFIENEYDGNKGAEAFEFYACADWFDSRGNKVKNWKQKMRGVWFKDDNKVRANGKQNGFMSVSEQNTQTCKEWINGE